VVSGAAKGREGVTGVAGMKTALIFAAVWLVLIAAPYLFIGEYYGMVWYLINLPLSEFLKGLFWPISVPLYVIVVTLGNGLVLGTFLNLIISAFRSRRKN
jgi:hypothetical protein